MTNFTALKHGAIILYRITEANADEVLALFAGDSELHDELKSEYMPQYDEEGRQINYGFYATLHDELAGASLLSVDSWEEGVASTGADTLPDMRGRGVAPGSKPHLFYVAFQLLGLQRIETGCTLANIASKRSIEKTPGFVYQGIQLAVSEDDIEEDHHMYKLLREVWQRLYNPDDVTVIY